MLLFVLLYVSVVKRYLKARLSIIGKARPQHLYFYQAMNFNVVLPGEWMPDIKANACLKYIYFWIF
jgi:hypothetical protein